MSTRKLIEAAKAMAAYIKADLRHPIEPNSRFANWEAAIRESEQAESQTQDKAWAEFVGFRTPDATLCADAIEALRRYIDASDRNSFSELCEAKAKAHEVLRRAEGQT